jgi:cytochrome c oxidase cbb3-type subunit IV
MITMGVIRGLITLVLLLAFLGLIIWLATNQRPEVYAAAARLPLEDDDSAARNAGP